MIIASCNDYHTKSWFYSVVYTDCQDALTQGRNTSGVYTIKPDNQSKFSVYCDMETDGGGWTVFQRREDGSVDFDRYWIDYQQGFGNISRDVWLGLEKIHRLTASAPNTQLRVDLQDFEGNSSFAKYAGFSVGDSLSNYTLSVSGYNGTAGNPFLGGGGVLVDHNGQQFSTRDRDNDAWRVYSCAHHYRGGWWFHACVTANLNGIYYNGTYTGILNGYPDGMIWSTWRGMFYSLKFSEMKLRRN